MVTHKQRQKSQKNKKTARKKVIVSVTDPTNGFNKRWLWLTFFIIGINLFLTSGLYLLYRQTVLSFKVTPIVTSEAHLRAALPIKISIPTAQVNLSMIESQIVNGVWETSDKFATHLNTSARPNEGGNIIVYGHNLRRIFGPLKQVKKGDEINLTTTDGKVISYQVIAIEIVEPENIDLVLPTKSEVLTVYTCTGWLDSKRLVIKAVPIKSAS
jgi:LPXTG-site transpeptidase (sortase) family protein